MSNPIHLPHFIIFLDQDLINRLSTQSPQRGKIEEIKNLDKEVMQIKL